MANKQLSLVNGKHLQWKYKCFLKAAIIVIYALIIGKNWVSKVKNKNRVKRKSYIIQFTYAPRQLNK